MRKVAIVARAGTAVLAPFRDKEWEIWGLPWISYPRLSRAYEIHSAQFYEDIPPSWLKDRDWVDAFNKAEPYCPVYCDASSTDDFLNPKIYPLEDVCAILPFAYLENSISYMLAHAIYELHPGDEIGLWGVHLFSGEEALVSQASVTYLIGLAQGRGIRVTVAPGSPLFASNYVAGRYGARGGEKARRPKIISFAGVEDYAAMAERKTRKDDSADLDDPLNPMLGQLNSGQ